MPRLNNDQRNQAIGMLNAGTSVTAVSRLFGCTRKAIERLRRRFRATGNVRDRPRSGRPRVTTAADDRYIVVQHLRNRCLTATATARQQGIHPQTVRNRLRQNVQPIRAYRPYFGQILTPRHRAARRDWCRRHGPNATLMHDNARPHTAAATRRVLAAHNVDVLDWPANSPDLNPIEHVWDELGRRVRTNHAINTVHDLAAALQVEWNTLPAPFIQRYVDSMRCRITTCIAQNGGHMRY